MADLDYDRAYDFAPAEVRNNVLDRYVTFLEAIGPDDPNKAEKMEQAKKAARQWLVDAMKQRHEEQQQRIVEAIERLGSVAASADADLAREQAAHEQRIEQIKSTVRNAGHSLVDALKANGYAVPNFADDIEAILEVITRDTSDRTACQDAARPVIGAACRIGGVTL